VLHSVHSDIICWCGCGGCFLAVAQSCFTAARTVVQQLLSMSAALVLSGSLALSQQDWCTPPAVCASSLLHCGGVFMTLEGG
jgi:hypothetical protein